MQSNRNHYQPQGLQKVFSDGLQPSPASQPEIPPPILSSTSQGATLGSFSRACPSLHSSLLLRFALEEKPLSSRRAFSRAPEAIPDSDNFKAVWCWLREVQPPIYILYPPQLTAITISIHGC